MIMGMPTKGALHRKRARSGKDHSKATIAPNTGQNFGVNKRLSAGIFTSTGKTTNNHEITAQISIQNIIPLTSPNEELPLENPTAVIKYDNPNMQPIIKLIAEATIFCGIDAVIIILVSKLANAGNPYAECEMKKVASRCFNEKKTQGDH